MVSGIGNTITFYEGYSWDGASGPAIDTKDTHLASLVHDGLYQAIRLGRLDPNMKGAADDELMSIYRDRIRWWQVWKWPRYGAWKLFIKLATPGREEQYVECS